MAEPNPNLPVLTSQDIERFWSKVDKSPGLGPNGDCWEWRAGCDKDGYGKFTAGPSAREFRDYRAHRLAYFIDQPTAYSGHLLTCHTCDNPPCVRSSHLFQGTQKDNREDAVRKNRQAKGDRQSARLYPWLVRRGESNPRAKLTEKSVRLMRQFYDQGEVINFTRLGEMFGVSNVRAAQIVRRSAWKHI